jgi:hypothetical protein
MLNVFSIKMLAATSTGNPVVPSRYMVGFVDEILNIEAPHIRMNWDAPFSEVLNSIAVWFENETISDLTADYLARRLLQDAGLKIFFSSDLMDYL